jgi:prepilin-type processing-associated H-X9-DG protein
MRNAIQAFIVLLILLSCGGMFTVFVVKVREAAARSQCVNNLKQLGMAMQNYHDTGAKFPKAAEENPDLPPAKRLSWCVAVWPYVEASSIYAKMDRKKGWDAEENRFAALTVLSPFQCPGYPERPPVSTLAPTDYIGIAGIGVDAAELPLENPRAGFFGYDRAIAMTDLKRGTSETLLLVETSEARGAWTAAGTPTSRGLDPHGSPYFGVGGQFGGNHSAGTNAVFADGSVRLLEKSIDPAVWEAMATLSGQGNRE